jgi:hypothetical protein
MEEALNNPKNYNYSYIKDGEWKVIETKTTKDISKTRHSSSNLQLPKGENYREVLLTLPTQKDISFEQYLKEYRDKFPKSEMDDSEVQRYYDSGKILPNGTQKDKSAFRSSHWDEPNVIAHIRLNDRTDTDGNKVLFVEEIQSDWAREAREKGVQGAQEPTTRQFGISIGGEQPNIFFDTKELAEERAKQIKNDFNEPLTIVEINRVIRAGAKKEGVSNQPFLKNWEELTLKRIIRMAAEEGYDKVSWITGEQTAERYDLSKQVDAVIIDRINDDYMVSVRGLDGSTKQLGNYKKEKLPEVIGKDIAEKVANEVESGDHKTYTGLDLKIGGEWAKNLYDKMIPKFFEKYGKKWGVKVENINLSKKGESWNVVSNNGKVIVQYDNYEIAVEEAKKYKNATVEIGVKDNSSNVAIQQSISITPEMRESVLFEGQPMFSRKESAGTKNSVKLILNAIEEDREQNTDSEYGIRIHEYPIKKGDKLGPSHDWDFENDTSSEDYLPGTSVLGLGDNPSAGDVIEQLRMAGQGGKNRRYTGGHVGYGGDYIAVVRGKNVGNGTDKGEILLDDAEVIGTFKRGDGYFGKIEGPMFSKGTPISENEFRQNIINENLVTKKPSIANEALKGAKKLAEFSLAPISTRLKHINPELKDSLIRYEFNIRQAKKDRLIAASNFITAKNKKMSSADKKTFDLLEKNGWIEEINKILDKYDLNKEYNKKREVLEEIYVDAVSSGIDVGYLENYTPRQVIDKNGLISTLKARTEWKAINKNIEEAQKESGGRLLTTDEIVEIADRTITELSQKEQEKETEKKEPFVQIGKRLPGQLTKSRKIGTIDAELNKYYSDSDTALINYINNVADAVEFRKMFGGSIDREYIGNEYLSYNTGIESSIVEENGKIDLDATIGNYTQSLINNNKIKAEQEAEVASILKNRFNPGKTNKALSLFRDIEYIDTMGSFYSALTQIQDQAFSWYVGGTTNYLKALFGKRYVKVEDLGIDNIAHEFTNSSRSAKILENVFKYSGLSMFDKFGKTTLINSAFNKFKYLANRDSKKFKDKINNTFGLEADKVIDDLKNNRLTSNVKYLLFSELLNFQPVAMSEMPEGYLKNGNLRILYMLKTYTIKQLDIYRNEIVDEYNTGDKKQAIKNAVRLMGALLLLGIATDQLKDWLSKRPITIKDLFFDNLFKLLGATKYTIYQVKKEGTKSALLQQITPPFKILDSVIRDVGSIYEGKIESIKDIKDLSVFESIPLIGKAYYWWLGKGAEKSAKKEKIMKFMEETGINSELTKKIAKVYKKEKGKYSAIYYSAKRLNSIKYKLKKYMNNPDRYDDLIETYKKEAKEEINNFNLLYKQLR